MTNFEKIKAMTIDEMAKYLCKGDFGCDECAWEHDEQGCKVVLDNIKEYLSKEVSK